MLSLEQGWCYLDETGEVAVKAGKAFFLELT